MPDMSPSILCWAVTNTFEIMGFDGLKREVRIYADIDSPCIGNRKLGIMQRYFVRSEGLCLRALGPATYFWSFYLP